MHILLADDEPDLLSQYTAILESKGHTVATAPDGEMCVTAYAKEYASGKENPFGAVVLDYSMPNMNGLELLKQIRSRVSDTPVILVSCMLPDIMEVGEDSQPFACLRKPYERVVLLQLIRSAIHRPHYNMKDEPAVTTSQYTRTS